MSELGIITAIFFLANMAVLGFNLKLYTEIMKEKSQLERRKPGDD